MRWHSVRSKSGCIGSGQTGCAGLVHRERREERASPCNVREEARGWHGQMVAQVHFIERTRPCEVRKDMRRAKRRTKPACWCCSGPHAVPHVLWRANVRVPLPTSPASQGQTRCTAVHCGAVRRATGKKAPGGGGGGRREAEAAEAATRRTLLSTPNTRKYSLRPKRLPSGAVIPSRDASPPRPSRCAAEAACDPSPSKSACLSPSMPAACP